jgi:hypothetical protein
MAMIAPRLKRYVDEHIFGKLPEAEAEDLYGPAGEAYERVILPADKKAATKLIVDNIIDCAKQYERIGSPLCAEIITKNLPNNVVIFQSEIESELAARQSPPSFEWKIGIPQISLQVQGTFICYYTAKTFFTSNRVRLTWKDVVKCDCGSGC